MKPWQMMRRFGQPASGGGGESWSIVYDKPTTLGSSTGWGGYTLRQLVPASALGGGGSRWRLTFAAVTGGFGLEEAFVGVAATTGDWYDFDGSPVPLQFGASAAVVCASDSAVVCDAFDLLVPSSRDVIVSAYFSYGSLLARSDEAGWTKAEKSGNSAGTVDASGYGAVLNDRATLVRKIEKSLG